MRLSDRLESIIDMIGQAASNIDTSSDHLGTSADKVLVADIGTDHGLVPIEVIRRGIATSAIASDIGQGPIAAARENIHRAALDDKIETIVADGLKGITSAPDIIVISGMGGMLMKKILEEGESIARKAKRLILSPQSDLEMFRTFLYKHGYYIEHESCIKEDEKYYFIMNVSSGNKEFIFSDCIYGREEHFSKESHLVRKELICRELENYKTIADGLKSKTTPEAILRLKEIEKKIINIEEILNGI